MISAFLFAIGVPVTIQAGNMKPSKHPPHIVYGNPDAVQARFGITAENGYLLSGVIVMSAAIEYSLERYIWLIEGIDTKGKRPWTDGKPASEWLKALMKHAESMPESDGKTMLTLWCKAAVCAFKIRHDIAHGVPVNFEGTVAFNRNPSWQDEVRSREHTDFWADTHTLTLVRDAIAVLVRMISELQHGHISTENVSSGDVKMKALKTAASILGEFSDTRGYNPTFEKY